MQSVEKELTIVMLEIAFYKAERCQKLKIIEFKCSATPLERPPPPAGAAGRLPASNYTGDIGGVGGRGGGGEGSF